ncbi:MAG: NOL1/NOP2/sun family putative RNA methylase, partial [Cyanobacteria bacterium]|nr:NOL1/NOP2/sun family putative RNA methylase [Cyanobacteriota bacterium]
TSAATPLPICLWANPLKTTGPQLLNQLQGLGLNPQPIPWWPNAFQLQPNFHPGNTLAYMAGWYTVQEAIALAAVVALAPQPGECILDLCAAPGGKTAQMAMAVGDSGWVVANDYSAGRLVGLGDTLNRLGCLNVITTHGNGRNLGLVPGQFDRVLVDAPCSGEGTLRKQAQPQPWRPHYSQRIAKVQRDLLAQALKLVKPGGVVVYSTCTFAPEENEAIIDGVLGDLGHLEPAAIAPLIHQPGLTRWQGQDYRTDLRHACRYFPHFNDTGGFFIARIRRSPNPYPTKVAPLQSPLLPAVSIAPEASLTLLQSRFGLPTACLVNRLLWATGRSRLWLAERQCIPLLGPLIPQTIGLAIARYERQGLKPTTAFLQRLGPWIRRNHINLEDPATVATFLEGQPQSIATDGLESGYVHVRHGPFHLGCGRYTGGQLQSQIPKGTVGGSASRLVWAAQSDPLSR